MEHGLKIWPVNSDLLTLGSITCTPPAIRTSMAVREAMQSQWLIPAMSTCLFQVIDHFTVSLNIDNEHQETKFSLCPIHFVNKPPKGMSKRKSIIFLFLLAFLLKQSTFSTLDNLNALPNIPLMSKNYRLQSHRPLIPLYFRKETVVGQKTWGKQSKVAMWEGSLQLKTREQTPTLTKRTRRIFFECLWRGYRTWLFSKIWLESVSCKKIWQPKWCAGFFSYHVQTDVLG